MNAAEQTRKHSGSHRLTCMTLPIVQPGMHIHGGWGAIMREVGGWSPTHGCSLGGNLRSPYQFPGRSGRRRRRPTGCSSSGETSTEAKPSPVETDASTPRMETGNPADNAPLDDDTTIVKPGGKAEFKSGATTMEATVGAVKCIGGPEGADVTPPGDGGSHIRLHLTVTNTGKTVGRFSPDLPRGRATGLRRSMPQQRRASATTRRHSRRHTSQARKSTRRSFSTSAPGVALSRSSTPKAIEHRCSVCDYRRKPGW